MVPLIATIVSNSSIIYFFIEKQRQGSLGPDGISAPFSDLWTLKFQAQPTNAFFATVNQMLGSSFQLPTTAVRCTGMFRRLNYAQLLYLRVYRALGSNLRKL